MRSKRDTTQSTEAQLRAGPLPPSVVVAHVMKNGIPQRRLHISAHVFVESAARTTIVAPNFQCFPHFKVVGQFLFIFVCHVGQYFRLPLDGFVTYFFVLRDARVVVIAICSIFFMLLSSCSDWADGLPYIH